MSLLARHPTPTLRRILGAFVLVCVASAIGVYVLFQARYLITGPQIALAPEPAVVQQERVVTLSGTAYNIARIYLNGRPIFTDERGNFEEALVLENGYTVATLRAEDRYGRTTRVIRPFVYRPQSFIP